MAKASGKIENKVFSEWIFDGAYVLDLGCGDGDLLDSLIKEKHVHAQGIELSEQAILRCVAAGLSVFQQDIDTGLSEFSDGSFDYVILNQTLQQVKKPDLALKEALRVGKKTIVGIPNFAYYKSRTRIFFKGRVPVTAALPYQWYDTPNLHFLSINDFRDYCKNKNIKIERSFFKSNNRQIRFWPNFLAEYGFFSLKPNSV